MPKITSLAAEWPPGYIPLADFGRMVGRTTAALHLAIKSGAIPPSCLVKTERGGKSYWGVLAASVVDRFPPDKHVHPVKRAATAEMKKKAFAPVPVSRGIFAADDGTVPPVVDDQINRHRPTPSPSGLPATETPDGSDYSLNQIREKKERLAVEKADLELKIARGKVLDVETVAGFLSTVAIETRQALLAIPPRVAPLVAAERDPVVVARLLESELYQALENLAKIEAYAPAGVQ